MKIVRGGPFAAVDVATGVWYVKNYRESKRGHMVMHCIDRLQAESELIDAGPDA